MILIIKTGSEQWIYYYLDLTPHFYVIKWTLKRPKITISPNPFLYPILFPPTNLINGPTNRCDCNLKGWHFSPSHNIHVYSRLIYRDIYKNHLSSRYLAFSRIFRKKTQKILDQSLFIDLNLETTKLVLILYFSREAVYNTLLQ